VTGNDNDMKTRLKLDILRVSVGKRHVSVCVYDTFVEDESVHLGTCSDLEMFGRGISLEEIGVDDGDVTPFVERLSEFVQEIAFHDFVIELLGSSDIEREPTDFATDFTTVGLVAVILRTTGSEFSDVVVWVVEFVGHVSEEITERNVGLSGSSGVNDRVRVKVENSLLELFQ